MFKAVKTLFKDRVLGCFGFIVHSFRCFRVMMKAFNSKDVTRWRNLCWHNGRNDVYSFAFLYLSFGQRYYIAVDLMDLLVCSILAIFSWVYMCKLCATSLVFFSSSMVVAYRFSIVILLAYKQVVFRLSKCEDSFLSLLLYFHNFRVFPGCSTY